MDNYNDEDISFNSDGRCNYCTEYEKNNNINIDEKWKAVELERTIKKIKKSKSEYNCIIGVSGGCDSSYLVYKAVKLGLSPLLVHYDNGWNSRQAVLNIENLTRKLNLSLYTYVNNWNEFKDIQLSFIKASVLDIELVTDQAIVAAVFKIARKYRIKYILFGSNTNTESILPKPWYHWKMDVLNIKAIHKTFGTEKMRTYPYWGFFHQYFNSITKKIQSINLLEYLSYNKEEAKEILINEIDWKDYGGKHYESIFTRFYQGYILPEKFGIDKRRAHLSSLICSNQLTREKAIEMIQEPIYDPDLYKQDKEFVLKKLGLSKPEFERIMNAKPVSHLKYPSYLTRHYKYLQFLSNIKNAVKKW